MKYFAYGSNLSKAGMSIRCPYAQVIDMYTLIGYRLTFRGFLPDILPEENGKVVGGLWEITESDEAALDRFEGYTGPGLSNLYNKYYTEDGIMFYRMASTVDEVPEDFTIRDNLIRCFVSRSYDSQNHILVAMMNGLNDFGISEEELRKSLGLLD